MNITKTDATQSPVGQILQLVELTRAVEYVPTRPHASCLWRWCRKGVVARGGDRIRLEHRRIGGRVLTTQRWIEEFLQRLTAADEAYFDAKVAGAARLAEPARRGRKPQRASDDVRSQRAESIGQELDKEGL